MRGTTKVLVNPFKPKDTITVPKGATYISMNLNLNSTQTTKRASKVSIYSVTQGCTYDYDVIQPAIATAGVGGYWKYITLNEEIIRANGFTPEYKELSVLI